MLVGRPKLNILENYLENDSAAKLNEKSPEWPHGSPYCPSAWMVTREK